MHFPDIRSRPIHVFVLGLDEHNLDVLRSMPDADQYRFHEVFGYEDIFQPEIDFDHLLEQADALIAAREVPVDAIIGFWDFPVTALVPLLRRRYGLKPDSIEEVVRCEHKYWSRLLQQEVIGEYPAFALVDPHAPPKLPAGLSFPVWIKPVKSFASMLALAAANEQEYAAAIRRIRGGVARFGKPFATLMRHVDLPADIAAAGGEACIAEEAVEGHQVTAEGYRHQERTTIYGLVDSIRYAGTSCFLRYQYPSVLPDRVQQRMQEISHRVMDHVGLQRSTFNIEYFWDPETDKIALLEINPRHSQSHASLFQHVDGAANHAILLDLALGREPAHPYRQGRYAVAGTWFVRRFSDGVVRRHPTTAEVAAIEARWPGVEIEITARADMQLSAMHGQDSYSYRLATVFIGADSQKEMEDCFEQVRKALRFDIDDLPDSSADEAGAFVLSQEPQSSPIALSSQGCAFW